MEARIPPCPHQPPCPGCPRYGDVGAPPSIERALSELAKRANIPQPPIHTGAALAFRHRARLAVRGRPQSPKIGIFQLGTHRIVDIPRCGVHHPLINRVSGALKGAVRRTGTRPYADRPHAGDLRYLQVAIERASERAQVVLVGNAESPDNLLPALAALAEDLGDALHSLWWNGNPARSNSILGPLWEPIQGGESISEQIGGAEIHFPPGAFGQSHLALFDVLAARAGDWIPNESRIAEFYGGSGALSLGLASRCRSLRVNELNPHGLRGLELGRQALPEVVRRRVEAAPGRAGERLDLLGEADVVLLDPPRRGLDPQLLDALCAAGARGPSRIVYASCGIQSFLSDAGRLLDAGAFRLTALEGYALFPYSDHIETLARFEI
jgi:tRNA/tmRNA/rRNA uracil-C5-methylase (TrmA/RlmC/RlmD family)